MALTSLGFFVLLVASTRYVSLGTISASVFFVAISFLPAFEHTFYFQVISSLIALVIIFKHRENIKRLLSGTENKLTFCAGRPCYSRPLTARLSNLPPTRSEKLETFLIERWCLLRIHCEDGTVGTGEAGVHGWPRPTAAMIDEMKSYLVGRD